LNSLSSFIHSCSLHYIRRYELCERCWAEDVRDRPSFPEIVRLAEKSEVSLLEQWDEVSQ